MAKNTIQGIVVAVGGDTTGLQKALTDVNKKSNQLSAELRQVENALKLDPTNTTLLAQKQELLSEQVANTSSKLRELQNVQGKVEERYKNGDIGADAYRTFQRELVSTENWLKKLEEQQRATNAAVSDTTDETTQKIKALEKESQLLSKEMLEINNALKLDPTNVDLLAQKEAVLSQQVQNAAENLQALKYRQNEVEQAFENGQIGEAEYRAFEREVISAERSLESFQKEQKELKEANETTATTVEALKNKIQGEEKELSELKQQYTNVVLEQGENSNAAKELANQITNLNGDLTKNKEALSEAEKSADRLTQADVKTGNSFDELKKKISTEEAELTRLKAEYSNVVLEQGKNSSSAKGLASVIQALDSQLNKDREKLEEAEDATDELTDSEEDANEETEKAEKKTKDYGKALESLANIAATASQAIFNIAKAAGEMAVKGIKAATNVGMEFESSISQLAATMGTSVDSISDLTKTAKKMGATTQFSATQAAEGLNILAMSGLSAEDQIEGIDKVLNLAAAGSLSLEAAASYTTGAVKGFGDEMGNAQKYTDLMAKGATLANTDVNGLGEALSQSAASANSFGQDANGVTLSLLRLAEQNVTGSAAATALNRAMSELYTPSAQAKAALDELGVAVYDSQGNTRDFNTVVDELNGKLSKMSDEQANAYKNTIFGTQGLNAFNKMTASSTEKVEDFKKGLAEASEGEGSAAEQAKTMIDNLQGDITLFQSAAEGLGNQFYETFNQDLRDNVQFATDSLGELSEAFQSGGLEKAADVAGSIIADIANKAVEYAPTLIETATTLIDSVANALSENSASIASSAATLITSIANGLTSNTSTILNAVVDILHNVLGELPGVLSSLISSAGDFTGTIIDLLVSASVEIINALPDLITKIFSSLNSTISALIPSLISSISMLIEELTKNLPKIVKSITDGLPQILKRILSVLKNNLPNIIDSVLNMVEILIANLSSILSTALPELISIITEQLPEIITNIVDVVFENLPILLDGVSMLVMGIVNALPSMIENIIVIIPTLLTNIFNSFSNSLPSIIGIVGALILNIAEVLPNLIVSIIDVLPDLINSIIVSITTFLPIFIETGITLFTAIIEDLPTIINSIVEKLPEIIDSIIGALLDALPLLIDCGVDLFLALIENLPTIIMEIQECIPQIIEGVVKALIELFPRIYTVGVQLFMALVEKLPDVITKLANRMPEIVTGLTNKLKEHIYKMVDIGKNLVEGIWDGIKNAKDWLIDNIFSWCDTVTDSIKSFFGIHSPSTLFRDDIGNNLALGIGEGFADTMSDVSRDMQDSIPTAFDIDPSLNLVSGDSRMQTFSNNPISSGANVQTVQGGSTINFTLQIDNFNNTANTSVNDLSETIETTLYELIRRYKLAVR